MVVEAVSAQLHRAGAGLADLLAELEAAGYRIFEINRLSLRPFETARAGRDYHKNWLCLPLERAGDARRAGRIILRCAFTPGVARLNPLKRCP